MGPQAMRTGPLRHCSFGNSSLQLQSRKMATFWAPVFIHSLEPASGSHSQISLNVDAKRNAVMIRCLLHGPFPLSSMMSC